MVQMNAMVISGANAPTNYRSMDIMQQMPRQMYPQQQARKQTNGSQFYPRLQDTDLLSSLMKLKQQQVAPTSPPPFPSQPCISIQRRDSVRSIENVPIGQELSRYKTELCRPYEETGQCRYGSKCQFAHGVQELRTLNRHPRYKTQYCRTFHTTGFCSYGQRCNFIHNEEERRNSTRNGSGPQNLYTQRSMSSTGHSPAGSVNGDVSPVHTPSYLDEEPFHLRLSPTPSFGSDYSLPSSPSSPRSNDYESMLNSPLDVSLSLALLARLNI